MNSLAPRRPCKGRGTACGGRVGGEGQLAGEGVISKEFFLIPFKTFRNIS